eukprot:CAMPEP_0174735092 /NCGR_PEP_ID=MMETSP1094-20130205/64364_1 /TAXON_ID=156173 /ORGANISM="Chrysochromulina brevifilum, Strain UTEX LB 985" /LENGTH=57 /DNA_ID=CAMNT_0015938011 /DNA_START=64 /DNA_END=237 /DNA_ORIENTATION=-
MARPPLRASPPLVRSARLTRDTTKAALAAERVAAEQVAVGGRAAAGARWLVERAAVG